MIAPETVKTTKYEHVLPLLAGIEESDDIDGLLLLLNTVGGDIEAGLAIAEMIAGMRKPTVSLVLGGGHSIGIPLAVCTKKSFITPTASMTVHPVRMTGLVVGAPQTYRYFQRIQEQIADFVTANSKITREDFESYMMATGEMATDVGTILYGKEAVASGLIDSLGGLSDALGALQQMIEQNKGTK
jgi:ATP-dependent protease ClpP protease subunit